MENLPDAFTGHGWVQISVPYGLQMTPTYRQCEELSISTVSLGTYLGAADESTDRRIFETIVEGVKSGITYLDTAANYRCGRSESVVGAALSKLAEMGHSGLPVVVGTKAGFLPYLGAYPETSDEEYFQTSFVDTGIVNKEWIVGDWQCYHPDYLEWQFSQSLTRLQRSSVDIFFLHNPEALTIHLGRQDFDQLIRNAFRWCLTKVKQGRIRYFGLSTWGGFLGLSSNETLSLLHMYNIAHNEGGGPYFKFIQAPFSAGLPNAVTMRTQHDADGNPMSLIRSISELGMHFFGSAPFLHGDLLKIPCEIEFKGFYNWPQGSYAYLDFARSAPGLSTSIVGTTSQNHIKEAIEVLGHEPAVSVFENMFRT